MLRKLIIAIVAALALSGCVALEGLVGTYAGESGLKLLEQAQEGISTVEDATLGNAGKVMAGYCDKVPGASRKLLRTTINDREEAGGAQIGIHCPGDPPLTLGALPE